MGSKFSESKDDAKRSAYKVVKGDNDTSRVDIDGRLYHHLVVDETSPKQGILEIRPIDAARIRKVKEVKHRKDPDTGAKLVERVNEYYIYQE